MKSVVSSLNPYAASYIPLSKRGADGRTSVNHDSKDHDGRTVGFQTPQHITEDQHLLDSSFYAAKSNQAKSKPAASSYSSSSQKVTELTEQFLDDDPDMDIEYLRMAFPRVSVQSLRDVYMVNGDDLDAAIDMLNQLEFDGVGVESAGSLPETLDIGDVSESGLSADSASLKLKNVAADASTSSSPLTSGNLL